MGACATKSGDLKVKGEAPLVVEDAAAPPGAAEEKTKADGIPAAAETTDPADVRRRRSLSDLLKEDAEASDHDGEADQEAEKSVARDSAAGATNEAEATALSKGAEATKGPQVAVVEPSGAAEQDGTAEEPGGGRREAC
ncbi:uncharacterized protein LOC133920516 [Phragmites australis]|uniref:uncharacterized protein LOC133920516 n=1 Tax=Phragmites australis TaxID=29695 RepID=UPI002D7685C4|nr:uncharacterized protein LOC133920516 [Phragmites australis]